MTAISFPSSPYVGQIYPQTNGFLYTWNGTAWLGVSSEGQGLYGTWHDVTNERAVGAIYTNTRGQPLAVSAYTYNTGVQGFLFYVDEVLVYDLVTSYDGGSPYGQGGGIMIVPPGSTYRLSFTVYGSLNKWFELY